MKQQISTPAAPAAIGPYSQAIGDGEWLFCSGQIGIDSSSGRLVEGGIEHETRRVMENLREVLGAADLHFSDIVKTTIYVIDLGDFAPANPIHPPHLTHPSPPRPIVPFCHVGIAFVSRRLAQEVLRPVYWGFGWTAGSSAKRSGRLIWVKDGCTVLENQAIVEMHRASANGSAGSRFLAGNFFAR